VGRTVTMVSAAPAIPPAAMLAITEDEYLSMAMYKTRYMRPTKRMKQHSATRGLGNLH
jgi:hypothetical protein